ncbi:hypothetical protein [Paenibacillus nasutitermitis]|uniref:Glycoside hydrolase family 42 N-terminal domain-containing protein n=1 Tax=Paenibacillus nasutitermitis TaxID=1652958 RepID=A0A917DQV2_9BACL|nr:hypothetical protein [Paenibacillus nasutitermitis]GGD61039.1 hypothetical protein GCM10010911_18630 [Paenibacillus nasutitermitis]
MRRSVMAVFVAVLCLVVFYSQASAYVPTITPFPIGVYWSPDSDHTTDARYKEIKDMNANVVFASNGMDTFNEVDAALTHAANNGLVVIAYDQRMAWRTNVVSQTSTGAGLYVRNNNPLGQTFKTPSGTGWALNTVELCIDKRFWPSGTTLTLSIYDSPSKTTLIGNSSITGPVSTDFPVFDISKAINSNSTYYMELTSSSPNNVGWVTTSLGNAYADGQLYENGVAAAKDLYFKASFSQLTYNDGGQPSNADIDDIANHYKTNASLQGYNIFDEPSIGMMTRIQDTMTRFRQTDPNHMTFVNLSPSNASPTAQGLTEQTGAYVTSAQPLGQTFKTKPSQTTISTIQMWIDSTQWSTNENLTLSLWDSPSKTSLVAQNTLNGASNNWVVFTLNASVSPNTSYYFELTHNGGGNNSVGWVIRSLTGADWINDGTAYVAGTPVDADFWFTIDQNIQGGTYEDYVYRWVSKSPDVLVYDHYPFLVGGGMTSDYFNNLEIIRRQALAGGVDFWSFIQSIGITDYLRVPNETEMRYQIYTNLTYGAKGYIYFTYWTPSSAGGENFHDGLILPDGTKNASYTWAQTLNAEVLQLGPKLMSLTSQAVYHTGTLPNNTNALPVSFFMQPANTAEPLVFGYFTDGSGRKYVMVTNRDITNSRTVSFSLSPLPSAMKEISKVTGAEVATNYNSTTGQMSATFAPGEGKLFVLPSGY